MSSEAQKQPVVDVPALGITFKTILDQQGRREVIYHTFVERDVPVYHLNGLLDKFSEATDRQIARAELVQLEEEEDALHKRIAKFSSLLAQMEIESQQRWAASGRAGSWNPEKLSPSEKNARKNTKDGLKDDKERLLRLRERLQELRRVVNGNGADSSANSDASVPDR